MATTATPLSNHGAVRPGTSHEGKVLRTLVRWAVDRRQQMVKWNWNKLPVQAVFTHCNRLEKWMKEHSDASPATIRAFDAQLGDSLRFVMPGNAAGKTKLDEYQRLLNAL